MPWPSAAITAFHAWYGPPTAPPWAARVVKLPGCWQRAEDHQRSRLVPGWVRAWPARSVKKVLTASRWGRLARLVSHQRRCLACQGRRPPASVRPFAGTLGPDWQDGCQGLLPAAR